MSDGPDSKSTQTTDKSTKVTTTTTTNVGDIGFTGKDAVEALALIKEGAKVQGEIVQQAFLPLAASFGKWADTAGKVQQEKEKNERSIGQLLADNAPLIVAGLGASAALYTFARK